MLATGRQRGARARPLKQVAARRIQFVCLVAAPEAWRPFRRRTPNVPSPVRDARPRARRAAYIRPGLGDAGDRLFGT
jgi:uracil phosphoribosyltransferase